MKNITLLKLLLDLSETPHFKTAGELGLSACNLSKLSNGLTKNRPKTLQRAAMYFSAKAGTDVDADLLLMELTALQAVEVFREVRRFQLKGGRT